MARGGAECGARGVPLFAWVMSGLDWYMKERGTGRREGASPFFRRPGARSAVVAEGAELWVAVEVMVILLLVVRVRTTASCHSISIFQSRKELTN